MRPRPRHPYLDHDGVLAFAHRGGDRVAPENTMAAFHDAVGQGYRYLETDVHASKDGVVYAFHDDNLARMVGEDIAISTFTAAEIDNLRVHGDHHIPTMLELFETFPEVRFNIDAKAWPVVEPLIALINQTRTQERICIGSFSDARIKQVVRNVGECLPQRRPAWRGALSLCRLGAVAAFLCGGGVAISGQRIWHFNGHQSIGGLCP